MIIKSLILFSHGAKHPNWAEPFYRLKSLVQCRLPTVKVELAFLELMEPNLLKLVAKLITEYIKYITIVPIFLGHNGQHVRCDLPILINQLQQKYPDTIFHVVKAVGEDNKVLQALAQYCIDNAIYIKN